MKKGWAKYLLYAFLVFGVLVLIFKENNPIEETDVYTSALKLEENSDIYTNELDVYLVNHSGEEDYDICYLEKDKCVKKLLSIKTESEEAFLIDNYKHLYFFYMDNDKVKVYNNDEGKSYVIDRMKTDNYMDFIIDTNGEFLGVLYSTDLNERCSFLLIKGNKILYNRKYDTLISVSPKYLAAFNYDDNGNQTGAYLVSATEESSPIMSKELKSTDYYGYYRLGNKYITYEYDNIIEVYDNDTLELIFKTNKANSYDENDNLKYMLSVDSLDNIIVFEDKYLYQYDSKGELVKKSNKEIYGIDLIDKYVLSTKDDVLSITDIKNNTIKIGSLEYGELEGYNYSKENKKEGLYFVVSDSRVKFKEVYDYCKDTTCKGIDQEDLKNKEDYSYGYEYFYDYKTNKVTSNPTFINNGAR